MSDDDDFAQLVQKTLAPLVQVKDFTIQKRRVQVVFDFLNMNSFVEKQLDQALRIWQARYPGAGLSIIPENENYRVRYPFHREEFETMGKAILVSGQHARPAPGKVTINVGEIRRLTDNEEE